MVMSDNVGNIPSLPAIFPNGRAPVVRTRPDGTRELLMMRWGFPPPNIRTQNSHNMYGSNVRNTENLQEPPPKGSLKIVAIGAKDPYQMMLN